MSLNNWNLRSIGPALGAAMFLLCAGQGLAGESPVWKAVRQEIAQKWPQVPQIKADELVQMMKASAPKRPVLIDVRSRAEYDVSHIQGAVRAESQSEIAAVVSSLPPDRPIVLYCSVGVRSSRAAQHLIDGGRRNVFNLEGSLFAWANEARPLINQSGKAVLVHPYDASWGLLLLPALRALLK